jgi:4-hydroxy-tetrahydrodipicolinate synthase
MDFKPTGTGTAMITPFTEALAIDYPALKQLIDFNIKGGVEYLVVQGTTGESATCSPDEKRELLSFFKDHVGNTPLVYGIGGNDTQSVTHAIKQTDLTGVSALLSVSPYYNKPSQDGIYWHYMNMADNSPVPIIIYNVPGRTGSNIAADTTIRLANHPNICGIKEASGDLVQCMRIAHETPDDFYLISGDDLLAVPMISIGASGVISVLSNGFPDLFSDMIRYALRGNFKEANVRLKDFVTINPLMYLESNPVGVKQVLRTRGYCENFVRPPLMPASETLQNQISRMVTLLNSNG